MIRKPNLKVKDSGFDISNRSRLDQYWAQRGFIDLYKGMRKPMPKLTGKETVQDLYNLIITDYGFAGIEFGNWVNNEDRFNYLVSAVVAIQDLNHVLRFPFKNVGLEKIGLAFGARGQGGALAHFEPGSWIINMTRRKRDEDFENSGGVGALAHEYGHALDYYFGTYKTRNWPYRSLTLGRLTTTKLEPLPPRDTIHGVANRIVKNMIWKDVEGGEKTPYYEKLKKKFGDVDYWYRHNELFARAFEQYIQLKLKQDGISNIFLTQYKYATVSYPDETLAKKLMPMFKTLIMMMRKKL